MTSRLLTLLFLLNALLSFGQETTPAVKPEKPKVPFKDRIFLSPDLGLQFGTVTAINVSPKVGYRFTPKFAAGLGGTYIYVKDNTYKQIGYTFESNIYGGSVFAQYQLFESIRLYSQYEILNLDVFNSKTFEVSRKNIPALLAGGGYTSRIGENSSVGLMLLWDLIEDPNSIYVNPIIRIGIDIGL
jgi:hypothetical protein